HRWLSSRASRSRFCKAARPTASLSSCDSLEPQGGDVADKEARRLGQGSAADLLSKWRGAERDRVAAEGSASVAALAKAAADEASAAATETADAARLSL